MNPGSYEHETCSKWQLIPYNFSTYQYLKIKVWTKVTPFLKSAHVYMPMMWSIPNPFPVMTMASYFRLISTLFAVGKNRWRMNFKVSKCTVLQGITGKAPPVTSEHELNGVVVKTSNTYKDPGVFISTHMSFTTHYNHITSRACCM